MFKFTKFLAFYGILLATALASALSTTPLAFGIVPPAQFPSEEFTVKGARFSFLYGHHKSVKGLDFGLLGNITEQEAAGLSVAGIFNINRGETRVIGLQLAGVMNLHKTRSSVYGIQAALFANIGDQTTIYGAQIGIYNKAREVYGLQLGLVNYTNNLHGIQIGLANFNTQGLFGVSPLINIGF